MLRAIPILHQLWQIGGEGLSAPGDAAVYLMAFDNQAALIDAGSGRGHNALVRTITQILQPPASVDYLFLTHCHYDHCGGAAALRRHYGCTTVAHRLDAPFIESGDRVVTAAQWYNAAMDPVPVDRTITAAQESFPISGGTVQALHCPGHSPGSVVYMAERDGKKILFGQDVHGPLHPSLLSNRDDYITSLAMLVNLEADILCEGHMGVVQGRTKVKAFIQSFIENSGW